MPGWPPYQVRGPPQSGWPSYQVSGPPQSGWPSYQVPGPPQSGWPSQGPPQPRWASRQAPGPPQAGWSSYGPPQSGWASRQVPGPPQSRRPPRQFPQVATGGRRILDPDEGSPCPNASTVMAVTSGCIMGRFDRFYYFECQKQWLYDSQLDDVVPALLATCRSFGVCACEEPSCIDNLEMLEEFVPPSKYFPSLREWVMQVVSCHQSLRPTVQTISEHPRPFHLAPKDQGSGLEGWQADPEPLTEVLSLLSWFNGYFGPYYEAISPPAPLRLLAEKNTASIKAYGAEKMHGEISKAVERVEAYKICLHRAWVVVSNLPGKELNLPALIPDPDSPIVHPYLDQGDDHEHCTTDLCIQIEKDKEANDAFYAMYAKKRYAEQLHVCDQLDCESTNEGMFSISKLCKAIEKKQLTAWMLDGLSIFGGDVYNPNLLNEKLPFIAISHVWADGTGAGDPEQSPGIQSVTSCLFSMFCDIAEELDCVGVWWDAICIPEDKKYEDYRREALKFMDRNYSAAKYTVVHDLYLRNMPWIDAESACLALVLSSWFTRGWTALELARSDDIYVIFAKSEDPSDGYVLKNLDRDILVPNRVGGTACQLVTRAIIQAFRKDTRAHRSLVSPGLSYANLQVNDILIALNGRTTSRRPDPPKIACLLAQIELPKVEPADPNKPYRPDPNFCRRVVQGRVIRAENLFHMAEAAKGFGWQPASFFDLPASTRNDSSTLRIPAHKDNSGNPRLRKRARCDVIGRWAFICDPSRNADLKAFDKVHFNWPWKDNEASEAQVKIKKAITDATDSTRHHVILVDTNERYPSRGILVKVRKWKNVDGTMCPSNVKDIFGERGFTNLREKTSFPCEFVGVVHFSSSELPITDAATFVLLGTDDDENLTTDLDPRVSAGFIINSNVKGLNSSFIFSQKQTVVKWSNQNPEEDHWEDEDSIPDDLRIPRMRQARFNSGNSDMALTGYDEVQLSDPNGLFISQRYTN